MILYPDENFIDHFKIFVSILENHIESQYGTSLFIKQYEEIKNINKIIVNMNDNKPIFSILSQDYYIDTEKFKELFYINNIKYVLLPKIKFINEMIKVKKIEEFSNIIKIYYKNEECTIEKNYIYNMKYIYKGNVQILHNFFITIKSSKNNNKIYYINTEDKNLLLI
jgi:hypothetical protein